MIIGPTGLSIRPMRRPDVAAVVAIEAERHTVDAWSQTAFHDALDQPGRYVCQVVVAGGVREGGGEPLAYGVLSLAGDTADLDNLTVSAGWARQGIGRWLLATLVDLAAHRGAREVLLEVRHDNEPAIALYAAEGFREITRRRGYYAAGLDAIVMRRSINPSVALHG